MFRCGICNKNTKGKPAQIVLEWRDVVYPARKDAGDNGGSGQEMVRGAYACPACQGKHVPSRKQIAAKEAALKAAEEVTAQ